MSSQHFVKHVRIINMYVFSYDNGEKQVFDLGRPVGQHVGRWWRISSSFPWWWWSSSSFFFSAASGLLFDCCATDRHADFGSRGKSRSFQKSFLITSDHRTGVGRLYHHKNIKNQITITTTLPKHRKGRLHRHSVHMSHGLKLPDWLS